MKMIIMTIIFCVASVYGGYLYGKSQIKTEIVEKKVEVIKYVAQKRAKIQASPNADRSELLELMRNNHL